MSAPAPHLRPRSVPEVLDAAVQLTRLHFPAFLQLAAVLAIPSLVINLATAWLVPEPTAAQSSLVPSLWILPLGLVSTAIYAVAFGAMVSAASDAYVGRPVDVVAALRHAYERIGSLVGASLLAYLIMAAGFFVVLGLVAALARFMAQGAAANPLAVGLLGLAMFVALIAAFVWGAIAAVRFANVTAAVVVEDARPVAALRRSRELARGSGRRVLGLLALLLLLALVLLVPVNAALDAVLDHEQLAAALTAFVGVPLYPPLACVFTVLYYDLRIRKEGFDIELMARDLAAGGPASGGPAGGGLDAHVAR